ncbi:hypothetical protein BON30_30380 [Cystobacter ferrugineus]|uniref:Amino acid permease n=1 Tax=Cystobacter ferrugineus TaxID=83449 RepID=A0A1L9B3L1_9BACT|nr:hypothetical protein BON30_30380 [Cystobacter ferrugineus]
MIIHYITSVMGVGILIIPGHAAEIAGPASLLAWLALIVYSYPFALIFARLSVRHPDSRGIASFVEHAFGPYWGKVIALFLLFTLLIANPVLGIAGARYLSKLVAIPEGSMLLLAGYLIMSGSILFNLLGLKVSTRVQGVVLGTLIAFLVLVVSMALPQGDPGNLTPVAPNGWLAIGSALIVCFFGFIGWENAAPVAEEVIAPERTFPRAIFWAVLLVGLLYFAMALTVVLVIPPEVQYSDRVTVFSTVLGIISGHEVARVGNAVALVLLLLTTNAWVLGTSRVVYALSRDGILPASLSRVSARTGAPYAALLFLLLGYGIVVAAVAWAGKDEAALITASSAAFMLIFLATFVSALRLLRGNGIRRCIWLVIAVTIVILPFFRESLLFAALVLGLAFSLVHFFPRKRLRGPRPEHGGGSGGAVHAPTSSADAR